MSTSEAAPAGPIFCGNCGTQAQPGETFCGNCGRPLSGIPPAPKTVPTPPPVPNNTPTQSAVPKRSSTGVIVLIAAALITMMIVVVGGVGWFLLKRTPASSSTTNSTSNNVIAEIATPQPTSGPEIIDPPEIGEPHVTHDDGSVFTETRRSTPVGRDGTSSHVTRSFPKPSTPPRRSTLWFNARRLTESDLAGKSKAQLNIMRNEVYARHGYIFARRDLAEHFGRQSWYRPQTRDQNSVWRGLSPVEQYNVEFIRKYQRRFR